jgi:hypothetical protein
VRHPLVAQSHVDLESPGQVGASRDMAGRRNAYLVMAASLAADHEISGPPDPPRLEFWLKEKARVLVP